MVCTSCCFPVKRPTVTTPISFNSGWFPSSSHSIVQGVPPVHVVPLAGWMTWILDDQPWSSGHGQHQRTYTPALTSRAKSSAKKAASMRAGECIRVHCFDIMSVGKERRVESVLVVILLRVVCKSSSACGLSREWVRCQA